MCIRDRYWGDVPFKTSYSSSDESAFGERVDREVIYDEIISDLTFAKNNLDWADVYKRQGISNDPMWVGYFKQAGIEQTPENGFGATPLTKYRRHVFPRPGQRTCCF